MLQTLPSRIFLLRCDGGATLQASGLPDTCEPRVQLHQPLPAWLHQCPQSSVILPPALQSAGAGPELRSAPVLHGRPSPGTALEVVFVLQLKAAGISCRESSNSCDLPEFCTGAGPQCPANVYLHDGHACTGVDGYCYNGICQTHEQQCITLWGPGELQHGSDRALGRGGMKI